MEEKQIDLLAKDEQPIITDLQNIGINVKSVWDLVNNYPHPYLEPILLVIIAAHTCFL